MTQDEFWPLLLYAAVVLVTVGGMLGLPFLLGERHWRKPERSTESGLVQPYESGIVPTGTARLRLPLQYYLAAMFFVIFDVEAVFIYAWAVAVPETGWLGFWEMVVFISILLAALAYLWRVGALNWGVQYQRRGRGRRDRPDQKERTDADAMVA